MFKRVAVTLLAATVLLTGLASAGPAAAAQQDFRDQARASGLSEAQAETLQHRVDAILATIPGGRQISATEIRYDGLNVTFDPRWTGTDSAVTPSAIACDHLWFCIFVRGVIFKFYTCKMWDLTNWWGNSEFNNNQTSGTIARAYDQDYVEVWSHSAKGSGTVDVGPWWHFKPC